MFLPFEMIWQGDYENAQFALCNDYGLFHLWWRNQKNIRKGLSVLFAEEELGRVYI